jgi:hypothetical protein
LEKPVYLPPLSLEYTKCNLNVNLDVNNKYINLLKSIENPTKYFCRILNENIAEKPLKSQNKWGHQSSN